LLLSIITVFMPTEPSPPTLRGDRQRHDATPRGRRRSGPCGCCRGFAGHEACLTSRHVEAAWATKPAHWDHEQGAASVRGDEAESGHSAAALHRRRRRLLGGRPRTPHGEKASRGANRGLRSLVVPIAYDGTESERPGRFPAHGPPGPGGRDSHRRAVRRPDRCGTTEPQVAVRSLAQLGEPGPP